MALSNAEKQAAWRARRDARTKALEKRVRVLEEQVRKAAKASGEMSSEREIRQVAVLLERYNRRPREGEVVCHNHIVHTRRMGERNGFRYWCTPKPPAGWKLCPCGWRPELGVHYANPGHAGWWREIRKKLGSQEAVDRHVEKIVRRADKGLAIAP
jgi:hypothetical protein